MSRKKRNTSEMMEEGDLLSFDDGLIDADGFDDPIGLTDISTDSIENDVISSAASRKSIDSGDDDLGENLESTSPLSDDSVKMYLREIGRVPLLNAKQEIELDIDGESEGQRKRQTFQC